MLSRLGGLSKFKSCSRSTDASFGRNPLDFFLVLRIGWVDEEEEEEEGEEEEGCCCELRVFYWFYWI
jgi:hypothetical protein